MRDLAKQWDDWKPGYYKYNRKTMRVEWNNYEKSWFCNVNKIIHHNKKQLLNCKECNP